ncbi:alpha/beta hydrolase family protein [Planctomicrobium sp. SH527]|uniref:alpha/beta hydrolase family protein n=1 Tax=Planctomicrobium sp. SH527 TaxID=3448123 RepID=UPI003F5BBBFD
MRSCRQARIPRLFNSIAVFAGVFCISLGVLTGSAFADLAGLVGSKYQAKDSLSVGDESREDAKQCLQNLCWNCSDFQVTIAAPVDPKREDLLVRFPSPLSTVEDESSIAVMEWYCARDADQKVLTAPAVVVIHESGRKMPVGRMIAKGFQSRGIHAFLLQLPGYGERRTARPTDGQSLLTRIRQGIGDARRARDAVAVLPHISHDRIALQGTSLGGFVASTTAGLDRGYHDVFLMLSGGDLYGVIKNGEREAAQIREMMKASGLNDEALREITDSIEPNRLAHRLNPERTWLYSGLFDTVVPIKNARSFAKAASLNGVHHFQMPTDHYTGIVLLPAILDQMSAEILQIPIDQVKSPLTRAAE